MRRGQDPTPYIVWAKLFGVPFHSIPVGSRFRMGPTVDSVKIKTAEPLPAGIPRSCMRINFKREGTNEIWGGGEAGRETLVQVIGQRFPSEGSD